MQICQRLHCVCYLDSKYTEMYVCDNRKQRFLSNSYNREYTITICNHNKVMKNIKR